MGGCNYVAVASSTVSLDIPPRSTYMYKYIPTLGTPESLPTTTGEDYIHVLLSIMENFFFFPFLFFEAQVYIMLLID